MMIRRTEPGRSDLLEGLSGLSQDAILLQLRALHSLRSGLAKSLAEDDFLIRLARLQLGYYGELLQLVSSHFDRVAERLRDLFPAPAREKATGRRAVELTVQLGHTAEATETIANKLVTPATVTLDGWYWQTPDGAVRIPMAVGGARGTDGKPPLDGIPAEGSREFRLDLGTIGAPFAPGDYVGPVTILLNEDPALILDVTLHVVP